jgi:hypothetical protein
MIGVALLAGLASVLGQTAPTPTLPSVSYSIPVNFSAFYDIREVGGKLKLTNAIGAIGTDLWQTPLGVKGWYFEQTAWGGAEVNGGLAAGSGFGVAYVPPAYPMIRFEVSGGADTISGLAGPGWYVGVSVTGTIKFDF